MILSRIFQILWAGVDEEALQPRINPPWRSPRLGKYKQPPKLNIKISFKKISSTTNTVTFDISQVEI